MHKRDPEHLQGLTTSDIIWEGQHPSDFLRTSVRVPVEKALNSLVFFSYSVPFSNQKMSFFTPVFRAGLWKPYPLSGLASKKLFHQSLVKNANKKISWNPFWIRILLFLFFSSGIKRTSTISCSFLENNTQLQDQNGPGLYLLACVEGVWKGREREFPSRVVSRPNSLPLPFRTPTTQAIYPFSDRIRNGAKTQPFGAAHTYMAYITEYPLLQGMGQAPQQPEMPSSALTFIAKFFDRVYLGLLRNKLHFKSVRG